MPSKVIPSVNYFDSLRLLKKCDFTDSGGIQEEITSQYINKHALALCNSTETRTILSGHVTLSIIDYDTILESIKTIKESEASQRIFVFTKMEI